MAKKKAKKAAGKKRKPNPAFMRPMTPSASLGAVIGTNAMPRTEVTKKIWAISSATRCRTRRTSG
jgi:chromatin remodeling complex protein RSC6